MILYHQKNHQVENSSLDKILEFLSAGENNAATGIRIQKRSLSQGYLPFTEEEKSLISKRILEKTVHLMPSLCVLNFGNSGENSSKEAVEIDKILEKRISKVVELLEKLEVNLMSSKSISENGHRYLPADVCLKLLDCSPTVFDFVVNYAVELNVCVRDKLNGEEIICYLSQRGIVEEAQMQAMKTMPEPFTVFYTLYSQLKTDTLFEIAVGQ